jgi:DNA-directed RNA polymerase subunit E'/Rpb7
MAQKRNYDKRKRAMRSIYHKSMLTESIEIPFKNVGKNIKQTLENILSSKLEGKCNREGFIKPASVNIVTYSSGLVVSDFIKYNIVYEAEVCFPIEGMLIKCVVKDVTKAGIRAETHDETSPVVIFIGRDHHFNLPYFSTVKVSDEITIRVIGQRFELNDLYISIIAELVLPKKIHPGTKKKPYLVINK